MAEAVGSPIESLNGFSSRHIFNSIHNSQRGHTAQMGKKHNSKFPAAKIKKIIQENQDIGKLCNTIPPIIEKSLEIFLDDIVERLNQIVSDYELNKITLSALKKALEDSPYDFMKDALRDIVDLEKGKPKRPRKKTPEDEDSDYDQKKGSKMPKPNEEFTK